MYMMPILVRGIHLSSDTQYLGGWTFFVWVLIAPKSGEEKVLDNGYDEL